MLTRETSSFRILVAFFAVFLAVAGCSPKVEEPEVEVVADGMKLVSDVSNSVSMQVPSGWTSSDFDSARSFSPGEDFEGSVDLLVFGGIQSDSPAEALALLTSEAEDDPDVELVGEIEDGTTTHGYQWALQKVNDSAEPASEVTMYLISDEQHEGHNHPPQMAVVTVSLPLESADSDEAQEFHQAVTEAVMSIKFSGH